MGTFLMPMSIRKPTLLFLFFLIMSISSEGQESQKKNLTINDHKLWSQLYSPEISADGNWIFFQLAYNDQKDTLVLINVNTGIKKFFSQGERARFADDGKNFAFISPEGVGIFNLKSRALQWINGADRYEFSKNGSHIIAYRPNEEQGPLVEIINLEKDISFLINDVKEYILSKSGNSLAYVVHGVNGDSVETIDLLTFNKKVIAETKKGDFDQIYWSNDGDALLFTERISENDLTNRSRLMYYREGVSGIKSIFIEQLDNYMSGMKFIEKIFFSDDGEKVFFHIGVEEIIKEEEKTPRAKIEVWEGDDKKTFSSRRYYDGGKRGPWLFTWWPDTGKVFQISDTSFPKAILANGEKYAMFYSEEDYEPDTRQNPEIDLYVANLENGLRSLIAKKLSASYGLIRLSPTGRYISYFKEGNWWNYDINTHKNYNLTNALSQPFYDVDYDSAGDVLPYGNPGWTSGDDEIILYDQFDIWISKNDGSSSRRLTKGRESTIRYRLQLPIVKDHKHSPEFYGTEYSAGDGLTISAADLNNRISYHTLDMTGKMELLASHNNKLSELSASLEDKSYSYVEQSYNLAPRIWLKPKDKKNRLIYQTNQHADNYKNGPVELVSYQSKDGKPLKAILYYPDDYKPGSKYPMIVHIYERQSSYYYNYINPSQFEQDGFNPRLYTSEGYAVLYPDISYTLPNPGISATECIIAAVDATLEKGLVDKQRVGLIGHSFGGYETAFIITQTDIFATAVAGAPATDLTSFYFNIGWNNGKPDMWRFEDQQWRFGFSYFDDPEAFNRNSPLHQAEGINTPVLLWSGRKDLQVAHNQTIEFYLALKRLKKKNRLLIYPEEAHSIIKKENQKDLTERIKNWFDFYLKNQDKEQVN